MHFLRSTFFIGTLMFAGTAFAQSTTTTFSYSPFTDVPETSANYDAIEYLRTQNVVKGYLDGTFRPATSINRAEFVEFIINPFILDTNGRGGCVQSHISASSDDVFFSDVSKDAWYADNVCFAKMNQIVDGYPDGSFHPERPITFVEAAKVISNVFTLNIDAYQQGEFWYRPYVQSLSDLHAIPTSINRFGQTITRAEMAEIVYRLKVDSSKKSHMVFDLTRNTLSARAAVVEAEPAPEPVEPVNTYSRPSRRSIIEEARLRNSERLAQ